MRKFIALILCVFLAMCLFACQNPLSQHDAADATIPEEITQPVKYNGSTVFRFPEGTVLCGIDLSGKLGNDAYNLIRESAQNYSLSLKINDDVVVIPGKDMSLTYHEDAVTDYINAIKNGEDPTDIKPVTFNAKQLQSRITYCINKKPQNVSLTYDSDANTFVFVDSIPGTTYDLEPVAQELESVILTFTPDYTTTADRRALAAAITAESDRAKQALEEANTVLRTALTYSYTPDNSRSTYEALTIDDIGSFITFDENLKPIVKKDAVMAYAEKMSEIFSVGTNDGKFLTSLGEYIDFEIYYADQLIDTQALADDIIYCVENRISGMRVAPYLPKEKGWSYDLGGNYVEVNLTKQCLWVYNNYECVMYTPIVTGCLGNGWGTPNGAFDVVYKDIGATLMGLDVSYWMPFYGNYGLHDAPWRRVFNETEYLFNGSHGCVNIPPANARVVFHNVSWDTPVIVHGGAHYGHPVTQELYATTEYHVGINAGSFELDATPKYGYKSRLTYTCDNTDVITVSRKGVVTVVGAGTATITVETPDWDFCPAVSTVVTITVHESCAEQGHMVVNWETDTQPSCTTKGSESGECTACGNSVSRAIDTCHNFDDWDVVTEPTCTAEGSQERICMNCDHKETEVLPAKGHSFFGWNIVDATETRDGKKTATCYYCKAGYEEVIPAGI